MSGQGEDDLQASKTEGFKVGEKKTVEEYAKLGKWSKAVMIIEEALCIFHDDVSNIASPTFSYVPMSSSTSTVAAVYGADAVR